MHPSASPMVLPELTSGSNSPSISSLDTASDTESVAIEEHTCFRSGEGSWPKSHHPGRLHRGKITVSKIDVVVEYGSGVADLGKSVLGGVQHEPPRLNGARRDDMVKSGRYTCLFHPLDCHDAFDDEAEWRTHVLSHFRTHPTPKTARCPICPDTEFVDQGLASDQSSRSDSDSLTYHDLSGTLSTRPKEVSSQGSPVSASAWDCLLSHVATEHYQHGQTLAGSRPDLSSCATCMGDGSSPTPSSKQFSWRLHRRVRRITAPRMGCGQILALQMSHTVRPIVVDEKIECGGSKEGSAWFFELRVIDLESSDDEA
ncbi:hypothetical protein POX_e07193 [Penicillium oxalicum]|uniref:hypothetical protein n=1 Tax=Penicillium oxalicum TaxID=69781 RepID=UPI0020B70BD1|nr:hypothetical protein POX_e07193 [Penicillium oxalicum]KAI2789165.1 hypothetical protein POX_e07193 [Penicillium oxalicum]